jgi:hypothetical protein
VSIDLQKMEAASSGLNALHMSHAGAVGRASGARQEAKTGHSPKECLILTPGHGAFWWNDPYRPNDSHGISSLLEALANAFFTGYISLQNHSRLWSNG